MVEGLSTFRQHFIGHENKYVLIGGTACDLLFQEQGIPFRATKDLDVILIAEALTPDFGIAFWEFIRNGQYEIRQRSDGTPIFYRFQKPSVEGYPKMIELFSRREETLHNLEEQTHFTRIPFSDEVSSLSAILLNDTYYQLLQSGVIQIDGISILSVAYLILFKAKAWLDLSRRRAAGERVDSRDIKKHRYDVLHLATLLVPNSTITISGEVLDDIGRFLDVSIHDPIDLKTIGLTGISEPDLIERMKKIYRIT